MGILKCFQNTGSNIEMADENCDKTDTIPNSYHVNFCNFFGSLVSIILHLIDMGADISVIYFYYMAGKYSYFAWSVALTYLPSLIIALISIRMYVEDNKDRTKFKHSLVRIVLCILGLILQSAPLIRNCDSFYYAKKSQKAESQCDKKKQKKYYTKMLNEDSDVALLRVFETYLESAPQQVLQITLLLIDYSRDSLDHAILQIIKIVLGFLSMAWCMANYNRCIRFDQEHKKNISIPGLIVQFFWHLNFTVSRILAVSAVSTFYAFWTLVVILIHWSGMTVWVAVTAKTNFCGKHKILEVLFSCTFGLVYIFNFVNLKDGPTKKYYLIFFLLCAIENVIAVTVWGIKATTYFTNWVYYAFIVFPIACLIFSLVFFVVYYKFLHPSKLKSGYSSDTKNLFDKFGQSSAHEQGVTNEIDR